MPFNIDAALGIHPHALTLRARRAEFLAANIANSDTPNYKARDLDFRAVLGGLTNTAATGSARLATTQRGHLAAEGEVPGMGELLYRTPTQSSVDGNTVDPQLEYSQFAQNALQYQASLTFLTSRIRGLMTAIRGD
jgi:flagellar basal-body rod protein FlgB